MSRHNNSFVSLRACVRLALWSLLAPAAALAQETPAAGGAEAAAAPAVEEVVVTGSRIKQANLTSTSPIQVVGSEEILQNGTTDISTLINTLPQQFQNSVADFGNSTNPLTAAAC